jgi:hypothetical protein
MAMVRRECSLALALAALAFGASCTGTITRVGGTGAAGTSGAAPPGSPPPPGSAGTTGTTGTTGAAGTASPPGSPQALPDSAAATPLQRLGKVELTNTLHDLLPDLPASFSATNDLPTDNAVLLAFSVPGTVSDLEVKRFQELAEATIAALGAKPPGAQVSCAGQDQTAETACARAFVTSFAKRAFRRPPDATEVDDLMTLYNTLRTDADLKYGLQDALGLVVEAILQSPGFLYRWERGLAAPLMDQAQGLVKYDPYEMASRLSYFLWKSMPDATLIAAADGNHLGTPDEIATQARRLLDSPRADAGLADFATQWLELGPLATSLKDDVAYPAFKPPLLDSMRAESIAFSRAVLRSADPSFGNLLTARYTYVDPALAAYYGVTRDAAQNGRVDLTGTDRIGILTQGALMAVKGNSYRTSPVRRGKFILNRLLCTTIPPPPPDVVPELPPPDPTKTLRQQMAEHRSQASCAACHTTMDALGFAFEHFDGAGNYRKDDRGQAIDPSGMVTIGDTSVTFGDAAALAQALASAPQARECFTRQWVRFALDRFEQPNEAATVDHLVKYYEQSRFDTRALIVELTRSLPFTHRAPAAGEVLTP